MIRAKKIELVPIDSVKHYKRNRNKHPPEQIERLKKLIEYQGFRVPLIVDTDTKEVIAGNGRLMAAREMGLTEVPCIFQKFDSEEQRYAFMVSDNAIDDWAELQLNDISLEMREWTEFDLELLGLKDFDFEVEKVEPKTDEDSVPELVDSVTKLGDVWVLGGHRLMCGSSTSTSDVEKLFNGDKAVMWQSDPPYGINHVEVSQEKGQSKGYKKIANDDLQDEKLKEFIYESIVTAIPHLENNFAFYMWHAMKTQAYFSQAAAAAGILFHRQIVWVKPKFVFGRGQYHWRHELCLMGWLEGNEPPFYGERNQSTVWEIGRENDKIHPTQKPVAIWEPPILNHMKKNQIVYEPFAGSGSQIIAAEKNGVRCYAMELEPHYCDIIVKRWEDYTGKKAVLDV
jgi:DNA modification methylase